MTQAISLLERYQGCLCGLAVGDALGTSVEFMPRDSFKPVTDMVGGGPFGLQPGQWTDDTSMALCLGVSLLEKDGFDPEDQTVNLGDDTDTMAAICGQVAGAYYGINSIPTQWRKKLFMREFILGLAEKIFYKAGKLED